MKNRQQYLMSEWTLTAKKNYSDPFNDLEVTAIFQYNSRQYAVPAFWAGGKIFKFRFSPPSPGSYQFFTLCNNSSDTGLHGVRGNFQVSPYQGKNSLYRHGFLQVSPNHRYLQHTDGTPFFWLGDTWWMGFSRRWSEKDFLFLLNDRRKKGFSVIQIVAGLYPDMPAFDPRGKNEAGYPWEGHFQKINPAYFDAADRRISAIANYGLVPCIVGAWGYYLPLMRIEKMKQHWRYLIARWSCLPVIWCLAGEGTMPYYLSKTKEKDTSFLKEGWTEIARYVKGIDPFGHPVTIHPSRSARDTLTDPTLLDIDMLQTGHGDRLSLPTTVKTVLADYQKQPTRPVVEGEVCYEGIGEACRQEVQRMMFWVCWLSGAKGFTYGANGIWQINSRTKPYGPSPHGMSWGETCWMEASQLPGSKHLGLAKKLLLNYPWWLIEPHPEWVEPTWSNQNYLVPYAGGIPGKLRLVYLPPCSGSFPCLKKLEPKLTYSSYLWNPVNGKEYPVGNIQGNSAGEWSTTRRLPIYQDWVWVLER
ncbi:MAG: DUF4038 domain-containing protein [Candidatus Omnitrophica bacterium]|nr:DUF4038 domain-containing protein [Candidatus Omnitrophota bacterium]